MGYRVVAARTGGEHIARGHRLGGEMDCAPLDIGLPDMGGLAYIQGTQGGPRWAHGACVNGRSAPQGPSAYSSGKGSGIHSEAIYPESTF